MTEKTEFLFETDAEKAVLNEAIKRDKRNYRKKIIKKFGITTLLLIVGAFIITSLYSGDPKYLNASVATIDMLEEEKSIKDAELIKYNNFYDKYEIIVNKVNPVSEDIINNYNQVSVENNLFANIKLEEQTYKNYLKLKKHLLKKGYFINIKSGFRTKQDSIDIYNSYLNKYGFKYAEEYVAKPGTSEHNLGIAFDFVISKDAKATKNDYKSEEYKYLENICYIYGFIIRYPKGKEKITGYNYEPWHLRYVGTDLAKYLKKTNLTLEEYYKG